MVDRLTGFVAINAPAVILQSSDAPATNGQVIYYFKPGDTAYASLYKAYFIADFGSGPQTFPNNDTFYVLVEERVDGEPGISDPGQPSSPSSFIVTLTGDVTGSGLGTVDTVISANAVTYAKMQLASASVLLGNPTGSSAAPSEIVLGSNLSFSGNTLNATGGGGGSGTVSSVSVVTANGISGTVATATTTPAITLSLSNITPTTVNGNTLTTGTGTLTLATFTLTATGTGSVSGSNTGDQTIALTGNVTGSGTGSFATTIAAGVVTSAMLASTTGSGAVALATSPTFVTPILGTPQSGNLANCTFPTLNQNTSGNAATATALQTGRLIGSATFNGTANITLLQIGAMAALIPTAVKLSNYNAAASDFIPCDPSSASFTITFPTAPADGTMIGIKIVVAPASHVVNLALGGSDVFNVAGGSTTGSLSLLNQAAVFQYKASSAIWYTISTDIPLSQLDVRYSPIAGGTGIVTVGTVTVGTWNGTVISGTYGGTGVNNGSSTITIGGNVAFSGAFTFTGTVTANTAITFPTSGTLATTKPRANTITSSATPTPASDTTDIFTVTALAAGATFAAPTGSPSDGQSLTIRITDNGGAQTLAWNGVYHAGTIPLPTTTTAGKTMYVTFRYRTAGTCWDFVGYVDNLT